MALKTSTTWLVAAAFGVAAVGGGLLASGAQPFGAEARGHPGSGEGSRRCARTGEEGRTRTGPRAEEGRTGPSSEEGRTSSLQEAGPAPGPLRRRR
ncbi:hypothetical protein [Tessaracoccus massiliensis]|uniref:hypothetical protein n=1 Tax=Tessaracoccus massiliensis TaxID=1522311 RepID=UPI00058E8495|nr:hypothetical protein [Tessaracoccus massiliensis]